MIGVVIGMVLGVLAVWLPVHFLTSSTTHVTDASVMLSQHVVSNTVGYIARAHPRLFGKGTNSYAFVMALSAALIPALCAAVLLTFAKLAEHTRWVVAGAAVFIGSLGVWLLPGGPAFSIGVFASLVVVSVLISSKLLTERLAFIGAFLAAGLVHEFWVGRNTSTLKASSVTLGSITHTPGSLWVGVLSGLVVFVVFCAFVVTLHQPKTS
jgi:hypothetical protein